MINNPVLPLLRAQRKSTDLRISEINTATLDKNDQSKDNIDMLFFTLS
ncbi:MAG: hypothetical protein ACI9KN_001668 [Gammaproteobacteria bacterium]|jgi:hypothetical protein